MHCRRRDEGFSLLETLVAVSILVAGVGSLSGLVVVATNAMQRSRETTLAALLAQEKMEQLRAMAWGLDVIGLPITDTEGDSRLVPEVATGGTGLGASPANALSANVDGYCDFADAAGRLLGGEEGLQTAPGEPAFIRRWSITPLSHGVVLIRVHVIGTSKRSPGILARLASVRGRRGFR